ncbi:MAG: ATP-binding protein [Bacteroidota bacterium]
MGEILIGRKAEQAILQKALASREAEMISVIGRRRVGKTYLVRKVYAEHIIFELSGLQNLPAEDQLRNFTEQLNVFFTGNNFEVPVDWLDAFFLLARVLREQKSKEKKVIFFDEVPWMATHKSKFLSGLSYFWNSWAVQQNVVVVICGSAASWMIQKILRDTGGLHNRVTRRIRLRPFTLAETKAFLLSRSIHFGNYELLQLYMAMGGIPHYLKEIENGQSVAQNINRICFSEGGLLKDEFLSLYPALFKHADYHVAIIRALATRAQGLNRKDLVQTAKIGDSGRISKVLVELEESGFITAYPNFGKKKKGKVYRLTDEYSTFYLRFIEPNLPETYDAWTNISQTQSYKVWCGYAFENICLKHVPQIKKALGISGVYTRSNSFFSKGNDYVPGVQIDLLIDRNDRAINLVEIKFHDDVFTITKAYAEQLRTKKRSFKSLTQTRKHIFLTLITASGVQPNDYSGILIDVTLKSDVLFEEVFYV